MHPQTFANIVERESRDERVLAELERHGVASADEAAFDPVALEESYDRGEGPRFSVLKQAELPFSNIAHEFVGEQHDSGLTFLLIDAAPGSGPSMHSHPYEEIFIIQAGQATFYVGNAARIARAGEIVQIPAGQPHARSSTRATGSCARSTSTPAPASPRTGSNAPLRSDPAEESRLPRRARRATR